MVVEIRGLSFRRGGREILRGVSLSVEAGEFVALLGPNGAGKSTLLKHAAGVLPPPPGTVFLGGDDRTALHPKEAARRAAYVPQTRDPEIPFTVQEMIAQARYPFLSTWRPEGERDRLRVREAIDMVGLRGFEERTFSSLSGGEQQKVLIAAALAQDAPLLLVDEPTTFLDPRLQEEVFQLLLAVRKERDLALLVVTHEVNRALLGADRIVALGDGVVAREGPPEEMSQEDALASIYGIAFLTVKHPESGILQILPGKEASG